MDINDFLHANIETMKKIQDLVLDFLQSKETKEIEFQNLIKCLEDHRIRENKNELKLFLRLISAISINFHRCSDFFEKIERIIAMFKEEFTKYFTNYELFNIFCKNKRILIFLFNEKLITADWSIYSCIMQEKYIQRFYIQYFFNEFKEFLSKEILEMIKLNTPNVENSDSESFKEKQKNGENDKIICQFIQKDSIDDFIIYVTKESIPLSIQIEPSIFETNLFLLKNKPNLIEYAAFYGSIQIFQYLKLNNVELTSELWLYAIHGKNPDIIHLLEENSIKPPKNNFVECYIESIKCHHIDIMNYIKNNLIEQIERDNFSTSPSIHFYNFINLVDCYNDKSFQINNDNKLNIFYQFCKYDYIDVVEFLLKSDTFDINSKIILKINQSFNKVYSIFFFNTIFSSLFFMKRLELISEF